MQKAVKILFGAIALFYILGSSYQMYLFLDYQTHKQEITEKFCENKDKPDLHCNGKCHLKKQLKEVPTQIEQKRESKSKPSYSVVKFDAFTETVYEKDVLLNDDLEYAQDCVVNNYQYLLIHEDGLPPESV